MPRRSGALLSHQAASACWLMALLAISVRASSVAFSSSNVSSRSDTASSRPSSSAQAMRGPVAGDFVMLHRLRRGEETGIKSGRALVLLHDLRTFIGDADDGVARLGLRLLVDSRKHLLEASDLLFRLSLVLLERRPELFALRRLRHLW